jgi:hypothetical protein
MAVLAMSSEFILVVVQRLARDILDALNGLKMIRIDAAFDATKVIYLLAVWDSAILSLIGKLVSAR